MKKTIFAVLMCCLSIFSLIGLAGCGDTKLSTIAENFKALDKAYADNSQVFEQNYDYLSGGQNDQVYAIYKVKFGNGVQAKIAEGSKEFTELETLYGAAFAVSTDYIEKNRTYITESLKDEELSKEAHAAMNALNASLQDYINEIDSFVKIRNSFVAYFDGFGDVVKDEATQKVELQRFKKDAFGILVEKNIDLSLKLAEAVESTDIFTLLENISLQATDTRIVKEYIRAKILPVFTKLQISAIANKMNWDETGDKDGKTKQRINSILDKLKDQFDYYVQNFVIKDGDYDELETEEMKDLFSQAKEFLIQADAFYKSIDGLDIEKLSIEYENNIEEYKKSNALAENYLQNMETFATTILPNFLAKFNEIVYKP